MPIALLVVGAIAGVSSWLILGCWWKAGEPCSLSPAALYDQPIDPPWLLPLGTKVIQNEGFLNFAPAQGEFPANDLVVTITEPHCNDQGCTQVFERTGGLQVDLADHSIRVTSRYAVRHFEYDRQACEGVIPLCGGAGFLQYRTGVLPDGIYKVWYGPNLVGEIRIPLDKSIPSLRSPQPVLPTPTMEPGNSLYPPPLPAYPAPATPGLPEAYP